MYRSIYQPNPVISACKSFGNTPRAIRALIIHEDILPVQVRLCQHAFNTFGDVLFGVIERRDDAHERRMSRRIDSLPRHVIAVHICALSRQQLVVPSRYTNAFRQ
jgi:hypothetical protein